MTIAPPNHDRRMNCAMRWLLVGIIVFGFIAAGFNSEMVTLRRVVSAKAKVVDELKLQNAQLKNSFYAVLDTRTLVSAAERLGYVKDGTPSYLTFRSDGTAEQDAPSSVSLKP